jgi:ubiquinone/menaquinone biosynthesis C-methylase UbiE
MLERLRRTGRTGAMSDSFYRDHWLSITPEQLARYEALFAWDPDSAPLYAGAAIEAGQVVADFGCGPGHMAIELAAWVGPQGHVHAFDINADFVARARAKAEAAGLSQRITVQQTEGDPLPLPDACLDRILTRNTLIYVDDPRRCLREFRRVLKPGGKAHIIEGDWPIMVVEPVPPREWTALVGAASIACRTPAIGRKLFGMAGQAGFVEVHVQLVTRPDTKGRLRAMIETMADCARVSGKLADESIDAVLARIDEAIPAGTYLAVAPQFVVTATRNDDAPGGRD